MPKKEKHNIYTALKKGLSKGPHEDTGNQNIYTVMGWKPKKVKEPEYRQSRKGLDKK